MFKDMVDYNELDKSEQNTVDKLDDQWNDYMDLIAKTPLDKLKLYRKPFLDFLMTAKEQLKPLTVSLI